MSLNVFCKSLIVTAANKQTKNTQCIWWVWCGSGPYDEFKGECAGYNPALKI